MQQRESNDLDVNVGDKIKKIMKAAGMSQRMLARAAGVSNSSISRICAGANNIEMGTLIKICKALNKEPAELWHSGDNGIMWQYCRDPNDINKAMDKHDENWEGLTSAEQIISITYDTNHGCYVVFWRRKR